MSENKKQDLDDLNNEIAGRETGRIKRFLSQEARDYIEDGKKGKKQEKLSLLDILLMTDPVYAQLYSDVMEKIEEIDKAIKKALTRIEQRIAFLEENLADIRTRAQRLDDGTLIYRSQNGAVYTDDGVPVSKSELGAVRWKTSDPSWEKRREAGEALDSTYKKKEEIEEYRDGALQHAKDRMNDRDNPPGKDELQKIRDELFNELPDSVEANMAATDDRSVQSDFMKHFQSKVSGQNETSEKTDLIAQPTLTQETAPSPNHTGGRNVLESTVTTSLVS